jgi:thiamine pyrophosphokinase
MEVISTQTALVEDRYPFFSLLNVTGCAEGITIRNAKYPLENGVITTEYQYGISNEVLPGKQAEISVAKGKLLLIKVERE